LQRIFLIGWDGATFDLLRPWVAQGKLPHIASLLERGVHGPLRSTTPPGTFPAWTSFLTGMNPGEHGIFSLFRPRPGTYDLELTNSRHRRATTLWQRLTEAGRKVVAISLPGTFPPEPVNGVMISGYDFPGKGPGSFVDARGMYPRALYAELNHNVGPHPVDASIIGEVNRGQLDVVLERFLETIHRKAATAKYLMSHRPWDCFMIRFGEADAAGHQFWKYCDPNSPLFIDQDPKLCDALLRVYQELDRETGALLERLPDDTTVVVLSGHGFGGVGDWVLYPNRWLAEKGYLRFRQTRETPLWHGLQTLPQPGRLEALKLWAMGTLPAWLQRSLCRYGPGLVGHLEARVRYGLIDWEGTQAYFDENPYFPVLRVNLRGRQPRGTVEPGGAYEELRNRLIRDLDTWRHPQTGQPILERAFRREEIYWGPCLDEAPDVIPKWALHFGYSYAFRKSFQAPEGTWIEQVDPKRPGKAPFFTGKSGTHRDDGILVARGPGFPAGASIAGARLIDLAPTILHLLDVPVPDDMDGRVLHELFQGGSAKPLPRQKAPELQLGYAAGRNYFSGDEEARVPTRPQGFKGLGI
jgi:predicted AlkP superfamily phosphohydrolase/phosphomutase